MSNENKIILDLCGGTGAWSKPYKDAGYIVQNITLPKYNVNDYKFRDDKGLYFTDCNGGYLGLAINNIYGILAAPPCTMFSLARTKAKNARDLKEGMKCVRVCLDIIWGCMEKQQDTRKKTVSLKFWCMENPNGMLKYFLGKPVFKFNPYDFGDRYQKKTCLWGYFEEPKKNPVKLNKEEKIKFATNSQKLKSLPLYNPMFNPDDYVLPPDMNYRQARRAITPRGFAKAFYEANK